MTISKLGCLSAALTCLLALGAAAQAAGQDEGGGVRFAVPQGWKADNKVGKNVVFAMAKGKARFTVRPDRALTPAECKAKTEQMRETLIDSGKDPEPVSALKDISGLEGYMSSSVVDGGTNYFGNFTAGGAAYNFLLKNGDPAKFKEALSAIKTAGAAKRTAADGKPRLTPVTYSTDKPSRTR